MSTTLPQSKRNLSGRTNRIVPEEARVTGDRYTSREFMELELDYVWARVWNIGGRAAEIPEPGDFIVHGLGRDSILMVRQHDGSVRAFHNVCTHRGNRLVQTEGGSTEKFICSYHGWTFGADGTLIHVQDEEDFPKGNPCGKMNLPQIPCEVWAGFIWYNMDPDCLSLGSFLGEVKTYIDQHRLQDMTRTFYRVTEVPFNWKALHDNFCESYHLPTAHPQLADYYDDDYRNTDFELFDAGHSLMKMKGCMPSERGDDPNGINETLAAEMQAWGLDPKDFEGRALEVRDAMQKHKRENAEALGYDYFATIEPSWLTDAYHFNLFPGSSITVSSIGASLQRCEPHPFDPNKSIYEHWHMTLKPNADGMVPSPIGMIPFQPAERDEFPFGSKTVGFTADQDLHVASNQQLGFHSRGFKGAYLSGQENRIQQFHNKIDDYIAEGRRQQDGL
ncbi:MAG: Rieske 2Fe-2S domain-containing protein [Alphaproteobacteria bacterium]|nr:Rieske 2Fe-2S domain-containing protein [Alphaproteobacteria bacterium]